MPNPRLHVLMSSAFVRAMRSGQATALLRYCAVPIGAVWDGVRRKFVTELPDGTIDEFEQPCPYRIGKDYIVRESILTHAVHGCTDPLAPPLAMARRTVRFRYASDLTAAECKERTTRGWSHGISVPREAERFVVRFETTDVIPLLDLTPEQVIAQGFDARHPTVLDAPDRTYGIKWQFAMEWDNTKVGRAGRRARDNPLCWFCTFRWDILRSSGLRT